MKRGLREGALLLPTLPPRPGQQRLALAICLFLLFIFAVTVPFGSIQLPKSAAFVAAFQSLLFVNDLITASVIFAHFAILRWRSLLVLASGYLFTSLLAVAYAVAFPGLIWPAGLGAQTSGWIYIFWHCGLPLSVIAYVLLNSAGQATRLTYVSTRIAISLSAAFVAAAAYGMTWAAIAADRMLPPLFLDAVHISLFGQLLAAGLMLLSAVALAFLWFRRQSALDVWLMVVIWAWLLENAFFVVLTALRFSLSYYTSRVYAVITASIVLLVVLSEMTKLYAKLARANNLLERERASKLVNIEAITSAIAHEVKQPLAAISANQSAALALLQTVPPDLDEARAALKDADNDVHRVSEILDGIRALLVSGDQSRPPLNVNDVVIETLQFLRSELTSRGVVAYHELARDLPPVAAHKGQLREVIINLVHNALEAMDTVADRGRMLEIITRRHNSDAIVVAVKDSGPGFDPKQLHNIFDAFITTKTNGMGLGLAICRTIVEQHGGQLTAFSDGKRGALFQFVLPINSPERVQLLRD